MSHAISVESSVPVIPPRPSRRSTRRAPLATLLLLALLAAGVLALRSDLSAQCFLTSVWTVSEADNLVRRVSLDSLLVEETIAIDIPGQTVTGIDGIAIEPGTGDLLLLVYLAGSPGAAPFLVSGPRGSDLTVPLRVGGQVIGALELLGGSPGSTGHPVTSAQLFADLIAPHLELLRREVHADSRIVS